MTQKRQALASRVPASLQQRGVLSPDEIHRLASKTKQAVGVETGAKASCHSDYVASDEARKLQNEKLATLRVP